jgi:hypothetical protein
MRRPLTPRTDMTIHMAMGHMAMVPRLASASGLASAMALIGAMAAGIIDAGMLR